jgi:hypothetical protein
MMLADVRKIDGEKYGPRETRLSCLRVNLPKKWA